MVVSKKEEKQTMERYNKAVGRVLRALFMFHGALAEPSWDGKQLDKQRGGEKCLANSKLETDGYIKQRKTGTNNDNKHRDFAVWTPNFGVYYLCFV